MEPFMGTIMMFGGNFAPRNWAFCNGQLLPISQNTALFSILGTTYGGDGRTTFGLPDFRGRVSMHWGNETGPGQPTYKLGQKGGVYENFLNITQLPSHNHSAVGTLTAAGAPGNQRLPTNHKLAGSTTDTQYSNDNTVPTVNMAANSVTVTVGNTGGNQAIENRQPFQVVNYIICTFGLYPSRP